MPSDRFQIAAERAASSYPTEVWSILSPSERAAAIYRELRKLDASSASEFGASGNAVHAGKANQRNGKARLQRAGLPESHSGDMT